MIAERDEQSEINFPDWLTGFTPLEGEEDAIASQTNIFAARVTSKNSQRAILAQRLAELREEIIGLEGEIASQDRQLTLINDQLVSVREMVEKGLATRPRLLELERDAEEIGGARAQSTAAIARARQRMGETNLQITELDNQTRNEVVLELAQVQDRLSDLSEQIQSAQDVSSRLEIRAPIAGTVVASRFFTAGGVIAPGAPIMDIVPANELLIVEAQVDPVDIDVVRAGLKSHVRLSALNQRSQVPIEASVTSVSADLIQEPETGRAYYLVKVAFEEDPLLKTGGIAPYPGMQAEVMIVTGTRTPLDYLLRPITRSFRRAMRES